MNHQQRSQYSQIQQPEKQYDQLQNEQIPSQPHLQSQSKPGLKSQVLRKLSQKLKLFCTNPTIIILCFILAFSSLVIWFLIEQININQVISSRAGTIDQIESRLKKLKYQQSIAHMDEYKVRKSFRPQTPTVLNESLDRYEFNESIQDFNYRLNYWGMTAHYMQQYITEQQIYRSVRLLELVHNINPKGEFEFDHSKYYASAFEKYFELKRRVIEEKNYYDDKYNISSYAHEQIRFCIVVNSFNPAINRLYLRNLDSIFQQQYQNFHIVYISDASNDSSQKYVQAYMEVNQIAKDKFTIIHNTAPQGQGSNNYLAAHQYCKTGEVMVIMNGNDSLIGRQAFSVLNAIYQKEKPALVYAQSLVISPKQVSFGKSKVIPKQILTSQSIRSKKQLYTSNLKSMYVDLYRNIKKEDFQLQKGKQRLIKSEINYMTSLIQMAGQKFFYLKQLLYEENADEDQGESVKQKQYNSKIFARSKYPKLKELNFTNYPKTQHY